MVQDQLSQKPSYVTHAKCINCLHNKQQIIWFEKPITRCPNCRHFLRQNTKKSKLKEKNRIQTMILNKEQRERKMQNIRSRRWKSKNKNHISNYNKKYAKTHNPEILEKRKERRKLDDPRAIKERISSKLYKESHKEQIKIYNKQYKESHKEELKLKRKLKLVTP